MPSLSLFLPCAAGVEDYLAHEVHGLTGLGGDDLQSARGGVFVRGGWAAAMRLNLHCRLAQRVLVELSNTEYRNEGDLYQAASAIAWEDWFSAQQSFKVEITAQHSPLNSLNFALLRIKDAIADRFRARAGGVRPSVETAHPDVRVFAHLTTDRLTLYIDTSGEPLFKRGWRQDTGDAPLKETLAAALLAASGWWQPEKPSERPALPLYDPCCGSGTIAIEAAQIARGMPAGGRRHFGFEKLATFDSRAWSTMQSEAEAHAAARAGDAVPIFGSDVSHRMVDFAERNAERAGVAASIEFRGGDALQRMPPTERGIIVLNPPYGERIEVGGLSGTNAGARSGRRESAQLQSCDTSDGAFFSQLATHWKKHYAGWTAWVLTPDLKLPQRMRLKESRRVPMWNGPIECRLFRFDMVAGSARAIS
ncbi:MAG: THUMP domain-containing protein [Variovorax sp.]